MHISDEDLVDYLRGEASPGLRDEIARQLAVDNNLVQRLSELRNLLGQIDSIYGVYEPPADLVDATLSRIDAETLPEPTAPQPTPPGYVPGVSRPVNRSRSNVWDSTALTVCLTVLCCLLLPVIVRARFESRKVQCANNLRLAGVGLIDFALNDPDQRFPHVELNGPFGFAGVYAIHLKSFGVPLSPSQLRCASLVGTDHRKSSMMLPSIPTMWEFSEMAWNDVKVLRAIGGDYAYNLGVTEEAKVVAPQYAGRSRFAILADSPVFVGETEQLVAHDGMGLNILFEDGHVEFVDAQVVLQDRRIIDHPFRNLRGVHAVGLIPEDASLAPSHYSPLGGQRY